MRLVQAIVLAVSTTLLLAMPAYAKTGHCAAVKALVDTMVSKLPIEVDAVTDTTAVAASCDARQITLSRTVSLKQSRMVADFKDFLQRQDNEFVCHDKARRALAEAGWAWIVTYKFQDGAPVKIAAACE